MVPHAAAARSPPPRRLSARAVRARRLAARRLVCGLRRHRRGAGGGRDRAPALGAPAGEAIAASQDELEGRAYRPAAERVRWPASWALPARFPLHAVAVPPAVTAT